MVNREKEPASREQTGLNPYPPAGARAGAAWAGLAAKWGVNAEEVRRHARAALVAEPPADRRAHLEEVGRMVRAGEAGVRPERLLARLEACCLPRTVPAAGTPPGSGAPSFQEAEDEEGGADAPLPLILSLAGCRPSLSSA